MPSDDDTIRAFAARHARPYDPTSDIYDRPPFAADIKEGKNDPIYNAHSYHTKVPPRGIIPYILHYTEPGDLILDPFCGSGMTGVAALMCTDPPRDLLEQFPDLQNRIGPRSVILNDLSPAACHIARNYTAAVDAEAVARDFERIKAAVKKEFDWLYGTEHYEPAVGQYDPADSEVEHRIKNSPTPGSALSILDVEERTWELLTTSEVEARLGYSVSELRRGQHWGDLDLATVRQWVCIPATIQYTIWSDVYRCEGFVTLEQPTGRVSSRGKNAGKPITTKTRVTRGCGGEIVLWNAAVDDPRGSVREDFTCPSCSQEWTKYDLDYVRAVPVYVAIEFGGISGRDARYYRRISRRELEQLAQLDKEGITDWYPDDDIYPYRELMSMGVTKHGVSRISDFYTRRNLRALARLWAETSNSQFVAPMRFIITSTFGHIERTTRYKFGRGGNSSLAGLLYIGSITVEDNIMRQLETKVRQVAHGLGELARLRTSKPSECAVNKGSADDLSWLPDSSIDFIFTDPPFGGNIFYSDASMLYEAWLGERTDANRELVYHRRSKQQRQKDGYVFKTPEDYAQGMATAFREMFRVLKPGRWATVEFNNSDGAIFEAIKDGVRKAGFEIANMLLLDKEQKTFKQLQGAEGTQDVVDKDVLFNLHKPAVIPPDARAEDEDLERQVADAVRQHLQTLPERIQSDAAKYSDEHRTTATINSILMNALIPRGVSVEQLNLPFIERVCARYFRKVGQRWYLRGEAVGGTDHEMLFDEELVVRDEETAIRWLRRRVRNVHALTGELRPHWMRATGLLPREISETLVLEDLLSDNFWCDADTNRWREPTDDERERMNDDRALRVLHDAERYLGGILKRHPTEAERAGWIDTLYRTIAEAGPSLSTLGSYKRIDAFTAYEVIVRLFHGLLREGVDAKLFSRARKQTQVASRQLKKRAAEEKNRAGTMARLPLFEGLDDESS